MEGDFCFYHFTIKWKTQYGKAIYIVGSIPDLGQWKVDLARRLTCYGNQNWVVSLPILINKKIQYKYFQSDYQLKKDKIIWQTSQKNNILHLKPSIQEQNQKDPLKFMSFNLRYENSHDINEYSWENRKNNCVNLIQSYSPGFIGVQEAVRSQKQFLVQKLQKTYDYIGKARDKKNGEECGIFVNRNKFFPLQYGFEWISQTKKEGSVGFDAKLPRYYTYAVLLDKHSSGSLIMVANVHLDHMGKIAQVKGVEMIVEKFKQYREKYSKNIEFKIDCFLVCGDFNVTQADEPMKFFNNEEMKFDSARQISKITDKSLTFNGFKNKFLLKLGEIIMNEKMTIDHVYLHLNSQVYFPHEFSVIKSGSKIVSDHFPVMCSLARKVQQ